MSTAASPPSQIRIRSALFRRNMLLLTPDAVEVLGGEVEDLSSDYSYKAQLYTALGCVCV